MLLFHRCLILCQDITVFIIYYYCLILEIDRLKSLVLERRSHRDAMRYLFIKIIYHYYREVFGSDHFNFSFLIPTTVDEVDYDDVRGYKCSSDNII